MWKYLKYQWEIWQLDRQESKALAPYKKDYNKAVAAGDDFAFQIYDPIESQLLYINTAREEVHTKYLTRLAWKLDVPYPYPNLKHKWWTIDFENGPMILTKQGKHELRKEIDSALARKRMPLFSLITLLTGLVAAATGLVSVLMK